MATSGQAVEAFSKRSRFALRVAIALDSSDPANNRCKWDFSLRVNNTDGTSSTWTTDRPSYDLRIGGQNFDGGQVPAGTFDFRDGAAYHNIVLGTTDWITNGTINISAAISGVYVFGSASPSGKVVAVGPPAPSIIGIDQITPDSLRFRFASAGDGGAPLLGWQAQIATNPSFTGATTVSSTGTTTFSGLTPATTYYCRARGRNQIGYGPWSTVVSAMTASGAYVSLNGAWVPVPLLVSDGAAWRTPELFVSDGSAWEAAE